MNASRRQLADGRWHFQHGPIDCILDVDGAPGAAPAAIERAWTRFATVLDELVGELSLLRADLRTLVERPHGAVARRMVDACRPHADDGVFVNAMAAVAGSVADELVGCIAGDPRVHRAYVNDGGDIALHLTEGTGWRVGIAPDGGGALLGAVDIGAASRVRGVATSGWRGRSFSLGIADAVTVLAATAADADAAATIVGNAVALVDPEAAGVVRRPAIAVRDDSDLGARPVTVAVPLLPRDIVDAALAAGAAEAERQIAIGRIVAASLVLQGRQRIAGGIARLGSAAERTRIAA